MEYRNLGRTGMRVSPICLGTAFREQKDDEVCIRTIHRALDLGCNFVDTANFYGQGRSEEVVGRALKGKREDVVLVSKVCSPMGDGANDRGLSRFHIMREAERSLTRLGMDHVDVYLMHQFDATTPFEETLRALDDLVRQGKTRYVGCSNHKSWQIVELLWIADTLGLDKVVCTQSRYNLLDRLDVEPDLMPLCRKHGLGMMTYSALAIGLLTGRFRHGQDPPAGNLWSEPRRRERFDTLMNQWADNVVQKLIEIGSERDRTPAQVAIAWIIDHPEVTAAMIGPDEPGQVDENFGALGWSLTAEERSTLDEASNMPDPMRYV